jgi:hypothetical protein
MYKAIVTKYHGPTNTRPSRISAKADGLRAIFVSWDYSLSISKNHRKAAEAFAAQVGWMDGQCMTGGQIRPGECAFVFGRGGSLKRVD